MTHKLGEAWGWGMWGLLCLSLYTFVSTNASSKMKGKFERTIKDTKGSSILKRSRLVLPQ